MFRWLERSWVATDQVTPDITISVPATKYLRILEHDYDFVPLLNWSWLVKLSHQPVYKTFFCFICVVILIGQFYDATNYYIVGTSLLIICLCVEMARFDRTLLALTLREFEFYYLMFSILQVAFGASILFRRQDFSVMYTVWYDISLLCTFTFIFLLDAAPTYPRAVKALANFCCLLGTLRFAVGYAFISDYALQLDTPLCIVVKCFTPRSVMTSGCANISFFLIKILWQMRIPGMLVLAQTNLHLELDRKDELALEHHWDQESGRPPMALPSLAKIPTSDSLR